MAVLTVEAQRKPLLLGSGLAALWLILGLGVDGTTFHLAPLLVAAVPAIGYAIEETAPQREATSRLVLFGAATSSIVVLLLGLSGNLDGPSLLPFGGAVVESVAFTGVGVIAGLTYSAVRE